MDSTEEIICRVCGEGLTVEGVACKSCGTPHHMDCWEFAGKCSVYGCGETRSLAYAPWADLPMGPPEIVEITEDTPTVTLGPPPEIFPDTGYFAGLSHGNSVTGLKLLAAGLLIQATSWAAGTVIQPLVYFSVTGYILYFLAPIYWFSGAVIGVVALGSGAAEGRVDVRAVSGFLVGSFFTLPILLWMGLGEAALGGALVLFFVVMMARFLTPLLLARRQP